MLEAEPPPGSTPVNQIAELTDEERAVRLDERYREGTKVYLESWRRLMIKEGSGDPDLYTEGDHERDLKAILDEMRGVDLPNLVREGWRLWDARWESFKSPAQLS